MIFCDWNQEPVGPIHFKIPKSAHGLGLESDKYFCSLKCKEEFIGAIIEASTDTEETPCPKREDKTHCVCWYECEPCCACGDDPTNLLTGVNA